MKHSMRKRRLGRMRPTCLPMSMVTLLAGGLAGPGAFAQTSPASSATTAVSSTAPAANALPGGGRVVAGQATIQQSGSSMTIQQGTERGAIDHRPNAA